MSIASKMAGRDVPCPTCHWFVTVPGGESSETSDHKTSSKPPEEKLEAQKNVPLGQHAQLQEESAKPTVSESKNEQRVQPDADDDDSEFSIRKPATGFEELDLTPMVDVTFLLLIFFMITASFSSQKSIAIPPPEPDQKGAQQSPTLEELEENSILVEIDADNRIFVEDEEVASIPEIPGVLTDLRRESDRNELVVMPDDAAHHEIVVKVLDAGNEVGMQRIRIAARKSSN